MSNEQEIIASHSHSIEATTDILFPLNILYQALWDYKGLRRIHTHKTLFQTPLHTIKAAIHKLTVLSCLTGIVITNIFKIYTQLCHARPYQTLTMVKLTSLGQCSTLLLPTLVMRTIGWMETCSELALALVPGLDLSPNAWVCVVIMDKTFRKTFRIATTMF